MNRWNRTKLVDKALKMEKNPQYLIKRMKISLITQV